MSYIHLSRISMKIKEKGAEREVKIKRYVAMVA